LEYFWKQTQLMEGVQIILLVVAIDSEVLFQSLISPLGLSITFRMISRSEVELHAQWGSKGLVLQFIPNAKTSLT